MSWGCPGYLAEIAQSGENGETPITYGRVFKAHDPASGPFPVPNALSEVYLHSLLLIIASESPRPRIVPIISYGTLPAASIEES